MKRSSAMAITALIVATSLLAASCSMPRAKDELGGSTEAAVHNDLIRGMLTNGQYYAALAHIDEERRRRGNSDELTALRADALAALGRTAEAEAMYRGLLRGEFAGEGYHGLGLLHVRANPGVGIGELKAAVARRPTSAQWRNDLGYALMANHRYTEALPEIATATELDPSTERYRNNLLILLILVKDEARVSRLRSQWNIADKTLGELRRQAQALQVQAAKPVVPAKPARKG